MSRVRILRGLLRRDVFVICFVVFVADNVNGILSPTFSLYAQGLGASLTLIGVLTSSLGLTQLFVSMPVNLQCDKSGHKVILIGGMLSFAVATALFALAPNAYFLFPGRILLGMAFVSTFTVGIGFVANIVTPEERGLGFGLYATSMAIGFGTGPLIGAAIASQHGIAISYWAASALALVGAAVAALGLRSVRRQHSSPDSKGRGLDWTKLERITRDPNLIVGSFGNMLMSTSFNGAIVSFFPMYAAQFALPQAAINSMFSARSFASAVARLPTGAITSRWSSRLVMATALTLTLVALLGMAQTNDAILLSILLIAEGLGFGTFLTSGQAFVAEHSTHQTRGSAVGFYGTAGSLGSTIGPVLLGVVADLWNVQAVFRLTGALMFLGVIAIGSLHLWGRRQTSPAPL